MSDSDFLPQDLPFGADNKNLQGSRQSIGGRPAGEQDPDESRNYAAFVESTQTSYGARNGGAASIRPSSVNDLPVKLRRLLRRYPILTWALIGVFQLGVILLTAGIVLAAATANAKGAGGAKVAVIILVVWGLVLIIGSAAGYWTVQKGRKERARLEGQWAIEEGIKEKRMTRELAKQDSKRQEIKERERSLSRGRRRSTSRGRSRTGVDDGESTYSRRPSFQEMTPAQSQHPDENLPQQPDEYAMKILPLAPINPIPGDALGIMGHGPLSPTAAASRYQTSQVDRKSTWTHHLDLIDDDNSDSSSRARAFNDILIRNNEILMRNVVRTVSHNDVSNILPTSPAVIDATFGIMGSSSTVLDSDHAGHDTSPTLIKSSPDHGSIAPYPPNNPPPHPPPNSPAQDRYYTPPLNLDSIRPIPTPTSPPPMHTSSSAATFNIVRSNNGLQGSDQSDENFMAGVENPSDADSLDSGARRMTKARSMAAIQRWHSGLGHLAKGPADGYNGDDPREGARSAGAAGIGALGAGNTPGGRARRFTDLVGRRRPGASTIGAWDGEENAAVDDAFDRYLDEDAIERTGSDIGNVGMVRRFTGLVGRRSRSVGGWDEERDTGEDGRSRLVTLRERLRDSREASVKLDEAGQRGSEGT